MTLIREWPLFRQFICQHERIYIAGFGEGAKAQYRCKKCERIMPLDEVKGEYTFTHD